MKMTEGVWTTVLRQLSDIVLSNTFYYLSEFEKYANVDEGQDNPSSIGANLTIQMSLQIYGEKVWKAARTW